MSGPSWRRVRSVWLLLFWALPARAEDPAKAVEAALVAAEPKLHRCWEKAAADDFRVAGKVVVRVVLADGGKARSVDKQSDTTGKPKLVACVIEAFSDARVAGFAPGDSVEIPVTFAAEPNRTVSAKDVSFWSGRKVLARVLIDEQSAGAGKASLVLFEVAPGGEVKLPAAGATTVLFVADGMAQLPGKKTFDLGDALLVPPRAPASFSSTGGAKVLALFTPPGPEARYRGKKVAAAKPAGAARAYPASAAASYPLTGGKGRVRMVLDGVAEAYAGWIEVEPGGAVPEHVHHSEAELVYVLAGSGDMTIDGQTYPVAPGMAVHIPPGAIHGFKVTSTMPVEAVQFYAPSGPEKRFKTP